MIKISALKVADPWEGVGNTQAWGVSSTHLIRRTMESRSRTSVWLRRKIWARGFLS